MLFCKGFNCGEFGGKFIFYVIFGIVLCYPVNAFSNSNGCISGTVLNAETGKPIQKVNITLVNTSMGAATAVSGNYLIKNVPPGTYHLRFSAIGFKTVDYPGVHVKENQRIHLDVSMSVEILTLGNVSVVGASLHRERITAAPAAVSVVPQQLLQQLSGTGQLPQLLETLSGADIAQNGINDFNVNTRGFNSSLNRRVQVLLDHRKTATTFLGAQEWNTMSFANADLGKVEFVRGPGSALYGANAFSGVLNVTTPAPKDIPGTRVSVTGGERNSMRGDVRYAGVNGPWSYKFNFGGMRSDNWTKSRNISQEDLDRQEYTGLTPELFPLDDNDLSSVFANLRVDYALQDNGVFTGEGGIDQAQDQVFLTGIGRIQVDEVIRPWARLNYTYENIFTQIDYSGRKTISGNQRALNTGTISKENSYNLHIQVRQHILPSARLRLTWGMEQEFQSVDAGKTLTADSYKENQSALFGQLKYSFAADWLFIAAGRLDRSTLHSTQISPKAALVFSPNANHSFRISVNRAFQTPNYAEFFLRAETGPPIDLIVTEDRVERMVESELGLQPRSLDLPLNFDVTPFLALGNADLQVEKITGFETGYKGNIADKAFITVDVYYNRLTNFITDLLPNVNPAYPAYRVPSSVDPQFVPLIEDALQRQLGTNFPLLAEMPDGSYAFVLSYTNAGRVNVRGLELGLNYYVTKELMFDWNYAFFDFDIKNQAEGDKLIPNTPKHKFNAGLLYHDKKHGLEASGYVKYVDAFDWASGIFRGRVPSYLLVDVSGGVWIESDMRLGVIVSNLLDNKHYEMFGGSLNGRRALLSMTVTF